MEPFVIVAMHNYALEVYLTILSSLESAIVYHIYFKKDGANL